jgi:DnaD/phage-associated family protein
VQPAGDVQEKEPAFSSDSLEKSAEQEKKLKKSNELPRYTSEELAVILESREDIVSLINESQNIIGKVFNLKEISVIIGLIDYLGLDSEYILILLTYCVSIDKKSLHYIESTAFSLYDAGVTEPAQLTEEIRRRELAASSEGQIRKIFGIGTRAFTSKEKKFIYSWLNDMRYTVEIITRAYEVSANATGKASFPYTNAVLERWNSENLRTLEEIEAADKKNQESAANDFSSFDTDDFFAAAVRRSLGK